MKNKTVKCNETVLASYMLDRNNVKFKHAQLTINSTLAGESIHWFGKQKYKTKFLCVKPSGRATHANLFVASFANFFLGKNKKAVLSVSRKYVELDDQLQTSS